MVRHGIVIIAVVLGVGIPVSAQRGMAADEKQIRDLIAKEDAAQAAPRTQDRIFWSGAIKKPIVGTERGEEIPTDRRPSVRVPGSQRTKTTVRRIEVASSGDLAYEFSDSEFSFELKSGQKGSFSRSALRVWKKEAGQWKVAAEFVRPHYEEPQPAAK